MYIEVSSWIRHPSVFLVISYAWCPTQTSVRSHAALGSSISQRCRRSCTPDIGHHVVVSKARQFVGIALTRRHRVFVSDARARTSPPPSPPRMQVAVASAASSVSSMVDVVLREGVRQRESDGFVSATDMCKKFDKEWYAYRRSKVAEEYLSALATDSAFSATEMVVATTGQGTWVSTTEASRYF
jgi:hypothetical protein